MPDEPQVEEQAIAAPPTEAIENKAPANREEASAQLVMARMTGQTEDISRLEAYLKPAPEPEPEVVQTVEDTTETTEATETEDEPAGDTPQDEPEVKVSDRPRLTHLSDEDKLTANAIILLTRKGLSYEEASRRVLGEAAPQSIPGAHTEAPPEIAPEIASIETKISTAKARLTEIKAERQNLAENADLYGPDAAKLDNEQTDLLDQLAEARSELSDAKATVKEQAAERQRAEEGQRTSLAAVASDYPDAVKPDTELFERTAGIAAAIRANPRNPAHKLVDGPNFLRHCVEAAAKKMGLTAKGQTPAPVQQKPVVPQNPNQPRPASGSRASTPATPEKSVAERIAESEEHAKAVLEGRAAPRRAGQRTYIAR